MIARWVRDHSHGVSPGLRAHVMDYERAISQRCGLSVIEFTTETIYGEQGERSAVVKSHAYLRMLNNDAIIG
jgi:hypothetical protein